MLWTEFFEQGICYVRMYDVWLSLAFLFNPRKSFQSFPPCYSQSPLLPLEQKWVETVFNVNIVNGNHKSDNSQDYAQKPQRNCTFMNLASGLNVFLCPVNISESAFLIIDKRIVIFFVQVLCLKELWIFILYYFFIKHIQKRIIFEEHFFFILLKVQ
jgi:hypothetical protein